MIEPIDIERINRIFQDNRPDLVEMLSEGWAMPTARAGRQSPSHVSLSRLYRATIAIAADWFVNGDGFYVILGGLLALDVLALRGLFL